MRSVCGFAGREEDDIPPLIPWDLLGVSKPLSNSRSRLVSQVSSEDGVDLQRIKVMTRGRIYAADDSVEAQGSLPAA